jgi:hypothetical protein
MDQAPLLRRHNFRCALMLPCHDPRSARGARERLAGDCTGSGSAADSLPQGREQLWLGS